MLVTCPRVTALQVRLGPFLGIRKTNRPPHLHFESLLFLLVSRTEIT